MSSTVCANSSVWKAENIVDEGYLSEIETAPQGPRHQPVNHGLALKLFRGYADHYALKLSNEKGVLSRDNMMYIYTADINGSGDGKSYGYSLGFINYNNREKAFTGVCGTKVFICENGVATCKVNDSVARHTVLNASNIENRVKTVFDFYCGNSQKIGDDIERLKKIKLTDDIFGKVLLGFHRSHVMGATNIERVAAECDSPTVNDKNDSSMFRLYNAASWVAKKIENPIARQDATYKMNFIIMDLSRKVNLAVPQAALEPVLA